MIEMILVIIVPSFTLTTPSAPTFRLPRGHSLPSTYRFPSGYPFPSTVRFPHGETPKNGKVPKHTTFPSGFSFPTNGLPSSFVHPSKLSNSFCHHGASF